MKWRNVDGSIRRTPCLIISSELESSTKEGKRTISGCSQRLTLYSENPIQSPISSLGCKYFKIVQKRNIWKLITYYKSWADLDQITDKEINLQKYTSVGKD